MDKSWIEKPRNSKAYMDGVVNFIRFATEKSSVRGKIVCPCRKCSNCSSHTPEVVEEHLMWKGFSVGYTEWIFHGESLSASLIESSHNIFASNTPTSTNVHEGTIGQDDIRGLLRDAIGIPDINLSSNPISNEDTMRNSSEASRQQDSAIDDTTSYANLMQDCDQELYSGCSNYSKISFLLHLFHLKCLNGWSSKSFTMLLELLKDAFPQDNSLPSSSYEVKKLIKQLGLGYEKIHACPNDCMLFWKEKRE